ncbi:hypothetical protein ACFQ3P_40295 [Paraburkholderia sabiae]|uniref:Uncharacterized protein n=1 Tax=Paraburkholderia sabiae TaxID=273251 RepID=A0ABU9QQY1_9BURK|nr:hypothetical protein [Paraburkholderia sabiae]
MLRLLGTVLAFSCAITLILTAVQLYRDYERGIAQIQNRLVDIDRSYRDSLGEALWQLDQPQVKPCLPVSAFASRIFAPPKCASCEGRHSDGRGRGRADDRRAEVSDPVPRAGQGATHRHLVCGGRSPISITSLCTPRS